MTRRDRTTEHLIKLVDFISDDPYLTPAQAMKKLRLDEQEFWALVDTLQAHVEAGRPIPRRRPKTTWRDILAYG